MRIPLPKNLETSIRDAVPRGQFASVNEAMAEAVSLLLGRRQQGQRRHAMTLDELHRQMLADGVLSQLPNDCADIDDEGYEPVAIEGGPLSETIIRERRRAYNDGNNK